MQIPKIVAALAILVAFSTPSFARHHHDANGNRAHRVHYAHGSGACDGFHRCRCGVTAAGNFGIPYNYNGYNLKQAIVWRNAFPRTSFGPGVAGVQAHHVLKVVGGSSCASATVLDETGTYQRNVCNMTFHAVGGYGTITHSARSHRGHATYALAEAPVDRHATH